MWNIPAYLLAGMGGYAFLGWLVDLWLGTRFGVLVGLLGGTAVAMYTIWVRYGGQGPAKAAQSPALRTDQHDRGADAPYQHHTRSNEEML
jgi:hypothetical protein